MKRFKKYIAKHNEGITILGLCSLFLVADAEALIQLTYLVVPLTLFAVGAIGRRISENQQKDEES